MIELQLTGMAYGGEAFGRDDDGRMVFVPFTLPGERARVRILESHKRWARAYPAEMLETAALRIEPRCMHFEQCGGCHYQHIPYDHQLRFKQEIVIDQLRRIGGFEDPPVNETIRAPSRWNYRNHVRFHRTGAGDPAFYDYTGSELFSVKECHLPESRLDLVRRELDETKFPEPVRQIGLRCGTDDPSMIILHASGKPVVETIVERPLSIVWQNEQDEYVLSGDRLLHFDIDGRSFQVSAESFFQVNTPLIPELVGLALTELAPRAGERIIDLYAGVGLFSRFIVEKGVDLLGVEAEPAACADFLVNLEGCEDVELWAMSVEQALAQVEIQPDAVLLDPPRTGLSHGAFDELMRLAPDRILYVSCDPATLARDGKKLTASGYRLQSLTPIDMFPQTYHIETVSNWLAS